jgi:Flp pilus assembly pilin Flp
MVPARFSVGHCAGQINALRPCKRRDDRRHERTSHGSPFRSGGWYLRTVREWGNSVMVLREARPHDLSSRFESASARMLGQDHTVAINGDAGESKPRRKGESMIDVTRTLPTRIDRWFGRLRANETCEGQGLVEYALIILMVSIAVIASLSAFGTGANSMYGYILAHLPF